MILSSNDLGFNPMAKTARELAEMVVERRQSARARPGEVRPLVLGCPHRSLGDSVFFDGRDAALIGDCLGDENAASWFSERIADQKNPQGGYVVAPESLNNPELGCDVILVDSAPTLLKYQRLVDLALHPEASPLIARNPAVAELASPSSNQPYMLGLEGKNLLREASAARRQIASRKFRIDGRASPEDRERMAAEILDYEDWLKSRNDWVPVRELGAIAMPHAGTRPEQNGVVTGTGFCAVAEHRSYTFGVRLNGPDAVEYGLLVTYARQFENGQSMPGENGPATYAEIAADSPDKLAAATVRLAYRQSQMDELAAALKRHDIGSNEWCDRYQELIELPGSPLRFERGQFVVEPAAAQELNLLRPSADGHHELNPDAAGRLVQDYPGDAGSFVRSPIFHPATPDDPAETRVRAADGIEYALHPLLSISVMEPDFSAEIVARNVPLSAQERELLASDLDGFRAARPDVSENEIAALLDTRRHELAKTIEPVLPGGPEIG